MTTGVNNSEENIENNEEIVDRSSQNLEISALPVLAMVAEKLKRDRKDDLNQAGRAMKEIYDSLVAGGFEKQEALQLVATLMKGND